MQKLQSIGSAAEDFETEMSSVVFLHHLNK